MLKGTKINQVDQSLLKFYDFQVIPETSQPPLPIYDKGRRWACYILRKRSNPSTVASDLITVSNKRHENVRTVALIILLLSVVVLISVLITVLVTGDFAKLLTYINLPWAFRIFAPDSYYSTLNFFLAASKKPTQNFSNYTNAFIQKYSLSICKHLLPYTTAKLPNYFGQITVDEAVLLHAKFRQQNFFNCSKEFETFLCALLFPNALSTNQSQPCYYYCREAINEPNCNEMDINNVLILASLEAHNLTCNSFPKKMDGFFSLLSSFFFYCCC